MPVPRERCFALALLFCVPVVAAGFGQSLKQDAPAHLAAGVNRATLDSTAGAQYWDVVLNPGDFRVVFAGDRPQQVFSAGHQPRVTFTLLPDRQTMVMSQRGIPGGGTVYEGRATQRTRVLIMVEPVKSATRELTDYTLVLTGNVDANGAGER